jgi:hypothetical protein
MFYHGRVDRSWFVVTQRLCSLTEVKPLESKMKILEPGEEAFVRQQLRIKRHVVVYRQVIAGSNMMDQ